MAKLLEMPKLSPTMEEGVLSIWHKKEGDTIVVDDLLADVETDKATMEFRSFDKGTLLKVLAEAGAKVRLGQAVGIIGQPNEDISDLLAKAGAPAPVKAATVHPPAAPGPSVPVAAPPPELAVARPSAARVELPNLQTGSILSRTEREGAFVDAASAGGGRALASPYVRKLARDRGVELSAVRGSGPSGRITPDDVERAEKVEPSVGRAAPRRHSGDESALAAPEARPLSMMRQTIARRLTESKQTVPHFYLTIDVDASPLVSLRASLQNEAAGDASTPKLSLNDFIVKACALALVRVPECNASFSKEALLLHKRVDISVAVAIPDGLVTPVVRDADKKSVMTVAREIRDLAGRAKEKKLRPEEMQNGTFSISNLGMYGIDSFAAVINPPEGAILAVGQVRDEPVVVDGAVRAGKKMAMTLSCDHRVVDGAVGAAFLKELRVLLEHPMRILAG